MKYLVLAAVVLFFPGLAASQQLQSRLIVHPTYGDSSGLFLAAWNITNLRQNLPDNTNLFAGLGYREKDFWMEALLQFQWQWTSPGNHKWYGNVRFSGRTGEAFQFYFEAASSLTDKNTYYASFFLERKATERLSVGAETDNSFSPGANSVGLGPRASFALVPKRAMATLAYHLRPSEANLARLYLAFHPKF